VSDDAGEAPNTSGELLTRLENGVLWLTINRADKGNAVPYYVRNALVDAFRDAHWDLEVRAVVLTAAGDRHFCTGADLSVPQPQRGSRPPEAPERVVGSAVNMMRAGFQQLMTAIQDCEKPVIVSMNGTAAGGGSMLVLAADLVIAADNAKLIQVFVRRGLIPDAGVAYLLPRVVGMHKAKELIFFGDDLPAEEAAKLGLVNRVVPRQELEHAAGQLAERLASGPTKAIGMAKWLLNRSLESDRRSAFDEEAWAQELIVGTADAGEGLRAFAERRPPEFKGY